MAKIAIKKIVVNILQWEAKMVLKKYKPKIIGVTGSVGKTSTKEAIYQVLKKDLFIGKSEKSYNSEFGVPLTILGRGSAWNDPLGWLEIIIHGFSLILFKKSYPKWLVLEIGADHPNDIKNIVRWVKFDIGILTSLPEVPAHIEFFSSKEEIIEEKFSLIKSLGSNGLAILNGDDSVCSSLIKEVKVPSMAYGFSPMVDYLASNVHVFYQDGKPGGLTFKLDHNGRSLPIKINGVLGQHQVYPILAALAVADYLDINMINAIEAVIDFIPPPGRLRIIEGIKNTVILDDSYNASPSAMSAGLSTLADLEVAGRRIALIGDMLELGNYTIEAHRQIGELCAQVCDLVLTVGLRTKFIDEVLMEKGWSGDKIKHFDDSLSAGKFLQNEIKSGDLIFVKGSQSMRLEKAVGEIMAHPEDKDKLLPRQDKEWLKR